MMVLTLYPRRYLMMIMVKILWMMRHEEKKNYLRRYLMMGVPPSSSGGFHNSFTCSARTFLFVLVHIIKLIIKCPDNQYLVWLEESWFAGNVKNVDEAGCFKAENEDSFENYAERRCENILKSLNGL